MADAVLNAKGVLVNPTTGLPVVLNPNTGTYVYTSSQEGQWYASHGFGAEPKITQSWDSYVAQQYQAGARLGQDTEGNYYYVSASGQILGGANQRIAQINQMEGSSGQYWRNLIGSATPEAAWAPIQAERDAHSAALDKAYDAALKYGDTTAAKELGVSDARLSQILSNQTPAKGYEVSGFQPKAINDVVNGGKLAGAVDYRDVLSNTPQGSRFPDMANPKIVLREPSGTQIMRTYDASTGGYTQTTLQAPQGVASTLIAPNVGFVPVEIKGQFAMASKESTAEWLSKGTGIPASAILANYGNYQNKLGNFSYENVVAKDISKVEQRGKGNITGFGSFELVKAPTIAPPKEDLTFKGVMSLTSGNTLFRNALGQEEIRDAGGQLVSPEEEARQEAIFSIKQNQTNPNWMGGFEKLNKWTGQIEYYNLYKAPTSVKVPPNATMWEGLQAANTAAMLAKERYGNLPPVSGPMKIEIHVPNQPDYNAIQSIKSGPLTAFYSFGKPFDWQMGDEIQTRFDQSKIARREQIENTYAALRKSPMYAALDNQFPVKGIQIGYVWGGAEQLIAEQGVQIARFGLSAENAFASATNILAIKLKDIQGKPLTTQEIEALPALGRETYMGTTTSATIGYGYYLMSAGPALFGGATSAAATKLQGVRSFLATTPLDPIAEATTPFIGDALKPIVESSEKYGISTAYKEFGKYAFESAIVAGAAITTGFQPTKEGGATFIPEYAVGGGLGAVGAIWVGKEGPKLAAKVFKAAGLESIDPFSKTEYIEIEEARTRQRAGLLTKQQITEGREAAKGVAEQAFKDMQDQDVISKKLYQIYSEGFYENLPESQATNQRVVSFMRAGNTQVGNDLADTYSSGQFQKKLNWPSMQSTLNGIYDESADYAGRAARSKALFESLSKPVVDEVAQEAARKAALDVVMKNALLNPENVGTKLGEQRMATSWQSYLNSIQGFQVGETGALSYDFGKTWTPSGAMGFELTKVAVSTTPSVILVSNAISPAMQKRLDALDASLAQPQAIIKQEKVNTTKLGSFKQVLKGMENLQEQSQYSLFSRPNVQSQLREQIKSAFNLSENQQGQITKIQEQIQGSLRLPAQTQAQTTMQSIAQVSESIQSQIREQSQIQSSLQIQVQSQVRQQVRLQTQLQLQTKLQQTLIPPIFAQLESKAKKKSKEGGIFKLPSLGLKAKPFILSDLISSAASQNVFGKATSINVEKNPKQFKYERNLFGFVPTEEQIKSGKTKISFLGFGGGKPTFKMPKFKLGGG